jgi:Trypsin
MFKHFILIFCVGEISSHCLPEVQCGVPFISEGLIVHGTEFARGSFPWMVALLYTNHDDKLPAYFGGGVLISQFHVLTGE